MCCNKIWLYTPTQLVFSYHLERCGGISKNKEAKLFKKALLFNNQLAWLKF